jgi:DNA-binding transcriptional MocR family regulator
LRLCPVPLDAEGLDAEALDRECLATGARVVYLQPSIHNPTGVPMSASRRARLVDVVRRRGLTVIEDDVYGFLAPETPPLVNELSERWCLVSSLSKSLAGGYRVGHLGVSPDLAAGAAAALWASAIAASSVAAAHASTLLADGLAVRVAAWKRSELEARHILAREVLPEMPEAIHSRSPHVWLPLPRPWRPAPFVAEARARGVVLPPTEGFLGQPGAVPRAVRICLGPPRTREDLRGALESLALLALEPPVPAPVV